MADDEFVVAFAFYVPPVKILIQMNFLLPLILTEDMDDPPLGAGVHICQLSQKKDCLHQSWPHGRTYSVHQCQNPAQNLHWRIAIKLLA